MVIKPHLSPSSARELWQSTEHLLEYWNAESKDKPEYIFGDAFESLLLDGKLPDNIVEFVKPSPTQTMAAGVNKEAYAALVSEGKRPISSEELQKCKRLVSNCARYRDTLRLDKCKRQVEVSVEINGVKWKGRLDLTDGDSITEVKTLHTATRKGINSAIHEMLYDVQLRVYGLALGIDKLQIIGAEKSAPYMTNFVELSPEWIELADYRIHILTERFKQWQEACQMTGGIVRNTGYGSSVMASVIAPERWMM